MASSGIRFDAKEFKGKLNRLDPKLRRGISGVMEYMDGRMETHMKHNAPWTDRTTNARNGLAAEAFQDVDRFGIVARHSVDYGIYLEDPYSEYAIIEPTISLYAPKVMAMLTKLLDRLKG